MSLSMANSTCSIKRPNPGKPKLIARIYKRWNKSRKAIVQVVRSVLLCSGTNPATSSTRTPIGPSASGPDTLQFHQVVIASISAECTNSYESIHNGENTGIRPSESALFFNPVSNDHLPSPGKLTESFSSPPLLGSSLNVYSLITVSKHMTSTGRKLRSQSAYDWETKKKIALSLAPNCSRELANDQPATLVATSSSTVLQATTSRRISCPFRYPTNLNSEGIRFTAGQPRDSSIGSCAEQVFGKLIGSHIRKIPYDEITTGIQISSGEFGIVESSNWRYHGKKVAVKSLHIKSTTSAEQFACELRTLYECGAAHPGFPRVLGWRTESWSDGTLSGYIVMEKLDFSLWKYITMIRKEKVQCPSWRQRLKLMLDYAYALFYLHEEQRQVHGDIHLRNLMLKRNGLAVEGTIVDLGMSRSIDEKYSQSRLSHWTAPETANQIYTKASDVFSFGLAILSIAILNTTCREVPAGASCNLEPGLAISLHFMSTGEICINIPDSFDDLPNDSPPLGLRNLICKCLSTDPQARCSMQEVCSTLNHLLQVLQQETGSSDAQLETRPPELVNHTASLIELWYLYRNKFLGLFPITVRRFMQHLAY